MSAQNQASKLGVSYYLFVALVSPKNKVLGKMKVNFANKRTWTRRKNVPSIILRVETNISTIFELRSSEAQKMCAGQNVLHLKYSRGAAFLGKFVLCVERGKAEEEVPCIVGLNHKCLGHKARSGPLFV